MDLVFIHTKVGGKVQGNLKVPGTKNLWSACSGPAFGGTCKPRLSPWKLRFGWEREAQTIKMWQMVSPRTRCRMPRKPEGACSSSQDNIPALICQGQGKPWQHHLPR